MPTTSTGGGRMWLWGVTLSVVVFVLVFIGIAIWSFQKDVELVYDNYYDKDIVFEQQIRRVERTNALPIQPRLRYLPEQERMQIYFAPAMGHGKVTGELLFFRPSDLHQDRNFQLELQGDSLQVVHVPNLIPGLWRVKLNWTSGDLEYYLEQPITVR